MRCMLQRCKGSSIFLNFSSYPTDGRFLFGPGSFHLRGPVFICHRQAQRAAVVSAAISYLQLAEIPTLSAII